jgi:hypothetical protein
MKYFYRTIIFGISFPFILGLLKLTGLIPINWILVLLIGLAPLLIALLVLLAVALFVINSLKDEWERQ